MLPLALQVKRLRILMVSRLFIAAFLLFYAQFVFSVEAIVFYGIIAFISVLSIFYVGWLLYGRFLRFLAYFQIVCDLFLESLLIYYTGGVDSLFSTVYVLSILSAGIVLTPAASFFTAVGSTLCYTGTILLIYGRWLVPELPRPLFGNAREAIYLFYAGYVHVTIFFLVAALAYYFLQKIQQLEGKMKLQERLVFLGEVVSSIAHEIRNPLTSLQTFFEYYPQKRNDPEFMQKFNDITGKEINRINDLIKQLLEFAKPSPLELQDVNITQIIDSSLALLENQIKKSKVQIIREFNMPPDVTIKADPNKLKQAFINLILNAIEAMTGGGELTILTSVNTNLAPHLMISITDTGGGIKKGDLHHIFDPFFSKKEKGTGLGLAITEGIIKEHQGQIKVRSTIAVGTTFIIALPINQKIICST